MYAQNDGVLPEIKLLSNGFTVMVFYRQEDSYKLLTNTFSDLKMNVHVNIVVSDDTGQVIKTIGDVVSFKITNNYVIITDVENKLLSVWACFTKNNDISTITLPLRDRDYNFNLDYNENGATLFFENKQFVIKNSLKS